VFQFHRIHYSEQADYSKIVFLPHIVNYYYYEIVHEVHNKTHKKDNKNTDKLELKNVKKH